MKNAGMIPVCLLALSMIMVSGCMEINNPAITGNNTSANTSIDHSESDQVIHIDPGYPYFIVTDIKSSRVHYPGQSSIPLDITITSDKPERIIRHANGSVEYAGNATTMPVTLTIEGIGSKTEDVTLAYNETKTVTYVLDWGGRPVTGRYNATITTPKYSMAYTLHLEEYRLW